MPTEAIRSLYAVIQFVDEATKPIKQVNRAMDEVKKSIRGLTDRINQARESLLLIGGALSIIGYGGFRFWKGATKDLADFQDAMRVFRVRAGENADAILAAMEEAAAGTIDSTQIILNANRAMTMGIDPQYLPKMMEIARAAARTMGTDVQYMFESIAIGTARQSKLILDNLGIIVKADEAYERYAKTLGKTASQLTEAEKRQAFLMAVMESGDDIVRKTDLSQESLNETMQQATTAWKEFKKELALGALPVLKSVIGGVKSTTEWLKNLPKPIKAIAGTFGVLATAVAGTVGPLMLQAAAFAWVSQTIGGFAGLRAILTGFTTSIWAAMAPLLPWIALIGAVVGAILLLQDVMVKGWEKSYLGRIVNWLLEKFPPLQSAIDTVTKTVTYLRSGFEWLTNIIEKFIQIIQNVWKAITENPIFQAIQALMQFTPAGMALKAAKILAEHRPPSIPTISPAAVSSVSNVRRVENKTIYVPKIEINVKKGDEREVRNAVRKVFREDLATYGY
jgi:hypothetical protein